MKKQPRFKLIFSKNFLLILCSFIPLIFLTSCTMKPAPQSGFLGDYSQMKTLKDGKTLCIDKNPQKDLKNYPKINRLSLSYGN